jgi:Xaa-Pro aminopeptidase
MSELSNRMELLRAAMDREGVSLVAVGPSANMRYLAGYASHPDERLCLLLVTAREARVVVPSLNAEEWVAYTDLPLYRWADDVGPRDALTAALDGMMPVGRLAVDGSMRADFLLQLLESADPDEALPLSSLDIPLRLRKSAAEVEAMARAAAQADRAMQAAVDACRPGVTEQEVAWAAEEAFRLDGAEEVCFTLVASGPNGAFPHHHSGERKMQAGDAVVIDIGASLDGYKSDITRMVYLGEPTTEFLAAYVAVLQANEAARALVKPEVSAESVDTAARSTLEAAGYGEYFVHRTGHGLGLEIHEAPWIMQGNESPLAEGMVFSVEPGVYLPGEFGVRIEDIVAVTAGGVVTLTGYDHGLVVKS